MLVLLSPRTDYGRVLDAALARTVAGQGRLTIVGLSPTPPVNDWFTYVAVLSQRDIDRGVEQALRDALLAAPENVSVSWRIERGGVWTAAMRVARRGQYDVVVVPRLWAWVFRAAVRRTAAGIRPDVIPA